MRTLSGASSPRTVYAFMAVTLPLVIAQPLAAGLSDKPSGGTDRIPSSLAAMIQARQAVVSGRILWQVRDERWKSGEYLRYESSYARDGDALFTHLGNAEGWTEFKRGKDPAAPIPVNKRRIRILHDERGWWEYAEGRSLVRHVDSVIAKERPHMIPTEAVKDVKALAASAFVQTINSDKGFSSLMTCASSPIASWQEQRLSDGRYEVVGTTSQGIEVSWLINPERGWNAEEARCRVGDTVVREMRCELRNWGGTWFPAHVQYYVKGQLDTTVRVLEVDVNRDDDPASFTLAVLGIQPGTQFGLNIHDLPSVEWQKENPGWLPIWNGDEITTIAEFREDVRAGRRVWGPLFQPGAKDPFATPEQERRIELTEREVSAGMRIKTVLSLWERYVRSFIEKYQLDESQRNTAMKILEQCQQMAWRVVKRQHPERTRLETKLEKAREEKNTKAHEKALKELRALLEPINKIFEERLKPRLEKLPTRAQRTAAKEAEKAADAERSKVVDEINRAGGGG